MLVHIDTDNEPAQALIDHWGQYNPTFPILTNCGNLFSAWGEGYIPHTIILDPLGVVVNNWVGWSDSFGAEMVAAVEANMNPTGIYFDSYVILSDTNENGVPEAGETIELEIMLTNLSQATVSDISASLSTMNPFVDISDNVATWPAMESQQIAACAQSFSIVIAEEAPAAMDLNLDLRLQVGEEFEITYPFIMSVGHRAPYWDWACEEIGDWTHSGENGWADDWHLSSEDSADEGQAWKAGSSTTGNYSNHQDASLISPPLELEPWSRLSFMHRMTGEVSGAFPDSAYDGGFLEISTDGANWEFLQSTTGNYNASFRWESGGGTPASHPFPGGTPCFSGDFDWMESEFDLGAYNGETVQFRFRFGSDGGGGGEGWYVDQLILKGMLGETIIHNGHTAVPATLQLAAAYPNPFNPVTQIDFSLAHSANVSLTIYNLQGQLLETLHQGTLAAGTHHVQWNATAFASGLYLLRAEAAGVQQILKLMLVK